MMTARTSANWLKSCFQLAQKAAVSGKVRESATLRPSCKKNSDKACSPRQQKCYDQSQLVVDTKWLMDTAGERGPERAPLLADPRRALWIPTLQLPVFLSPDNLTLPDSL